MERPTFQISKPRTDDWIAGEKESGADEAQQADESEDEDAMNEEDDEELQAPHTSEDDVETMLVVPQPCRRHISTLHRRSMPSSKPLCLSGLASASKAGSRPAAGRLQLRNALSGKLLCFPGPATASNGWTLPRHTFNVADLQGQQVFRIQEDNTVDRDPVMISAALTPSKEVAPRSFQLSDVAQDNIVEVLMGEQILPFTGLACTEKPCTDVSGVSTPPTPPPF